VKITAFLDIASLKYTDVAEVRTAAIVRAIVAVRTSETSTSRQLGAVSQRAVVF
jgi:hypothetical protein